MLAINNCLKPMRKGAKPINSTLKQKGKIMPTEIKIGKTNGKTTVLHCRIM